MLPEVTKLVAKVVAEMRAEADEMAVTINAIQVLIDTAALGDKP